LPVARDAQSARASGWWGANRLVFTQARRKHFLWGMTRKAACTLSGGFRQADQAPGKSHRTSVRNKHAV